MHKDLQIKDLTGMAKEKMIPISVLIEVCYTCNENCLHCCLPSHTNKGMSLKEYEDLFDQLVDAGTFFVILTGGEPFTRPDFMSIVRAARKRRLSVTIFTNGTLLTQSIINELALLYVDEVHISIYGADSKVHDAITMVPGSFMRSIESIKRLKASGITVRIKTPLMNFNFQGIKEFKQLASALEVNLQYAHIITAKNNGDMSTLKLRLSDEQLRVAMTDPDINPHSKKQIYEHANPDCIPCDTVLNGGAVDPDGNVYVCNQWRIIGGNVLETPFKKIWGESYSFQEIRKINVGNMSECKECKLLQHCTRCPGLAYLEDKNLRGCSQAAKKVAEVRRELGIFPTQAHIFGNIKRKEENGYEKVC